VIEWLAALSLRVLDSLASWLGRHREQRVTPTVQLVREARREGGSILREIRLAQGEEQSQALCRRIIEWYGPFELKLAEVAPDVFREFKQPGIPSGTVNAETGEVVRWDSIPLAVLREVVRSDLRALREIEVRLSGSVIRVRVLRLRRRIRHSRSERARARTRAGR
jgi:hypothetical protein